MPNSVLVFEESAVIRELCVNALLACGFEVDTVYDTSSAINAVMHKDYSFVIVGDCANEDSLSMPLSIRNADEAIGKYTPIIGVYEICPTDCSDIDDIVQMPVSFNNLRETVNRWFHYSRGRARISGAA